MAKLELQDVVSRADYCRVRPSYRRHISAARRARRLQLGPHCTLQFESLELALWHTQELLRAEGESPRRIRRTLDDVRPWCPDAQELTATLMIHAEDPAQGRRIANAVTRPGALKLRSNSALLESEVIGPVLAPDDPVWHLRWRVSSGWKAGLLARCSLTTTWDEARRALPLATRSALLADLRIASSDAPLFLHQLLESSTPNLRYTPQTHVEPQRSCHETCA